MLKLNPDVELYTSKLVAQNTTRADFAEERAPRGLRSGPLVRLNTSILYFVLHRENLLFSTHTPQLLFCLQDKIHERK